MSVRRRQSVLARSKPSKPRSDFPLFPHQSGKWAKKIKGQTKYFGHWDDPRAAEEEYLQFVASEQAAHGTGLKSGLTTINASANVSETLSWVSIKRAVNLFLTSKKRQVETGERSPSTLQDYRWTLSAFAKCLGADRMIESLTVEDFAMFRHERSKTCNVVTVGNEVTRIKTWLNWLYRSQHTVKIDPGPDFVKPSEKVARRHRRERGKMMFTADQVRILIDESGIQMRSMVLLAINCGFQNSDIETIGLSVVTRAIDTGWIEYPRQKTEVDRRCPLWKTTRKALSLAMGRRIGTNLPNAFVRFDGRPFSSTNHDLAKRFRVLRSNCCLENGGFSWLRKTFATAASGCGDQVAIDYVMGHVDPNMSGIYRQEVFDDRLLKVVQEVKQWMLA